MERQTRKKKWNTEEERTDAIKESQRKHRRENRLLELSNYCKTKGGELLSDDYISAHTPIKIKCQLNHEFQCKPYYLQNKGEWCPQCTEQLKKLVKKGSNVEDILKIEGMKYIIISIVHEYVNDHEIVNRPEIVGKGGRKKIYNTPEEAKEGKRILDHQRYIKNRLKYKNIGLDNYYKKKNIR